MAKQINCNDPLCFNYGKYNRMCGHGEAVIEQADPIAKVSEKRGKINKKEYLPKMKQFVKEHPDCAMKTKVCTGSTQCVHHSKGRSSEALLLNMDHWIESCFACNAWVETNDGEARNLGLKKTKHDQTSRQILYKNEAQPSTNA